MRRTLLLMVPLLLLLAACGYRFAGGGFLPGGAESLSVLMPENRSTESGIQAQLNSDIVFEFTRRESARIAPTENADAILSGVIKTVQDTDIACTGTSTASQRRVTLTIDMQLESKDGKVLWRRSGLSDYEAYDVAGNRSGTDLNRRAAIEKVSKRLAEAVYKSITDNF